MQTLITYLHFVFHAAPKAGGYELFYQYCYFRNAVDLLDVFESCVSPYEEMIVLDSL